MKRRTSIALVVATALFLTLAFSGTARAQTYIQYKVQLNTDGSATWVINQVSGANGTVDTWNGFQDKVESLVYAASVQTGRTMSVDNESLVMSTFPTGDSKTTQYSFVWLNFSIVQKGKLVAGDVFSVSGFFDRLYGDGQLEITYPANYTLGTVTPAPNEQDTAAQTLDWLGTQFFVAANPSITIIPSEKAAANSAQTPPYVLLATVSAVTVGTGALAGWFFLVKRRQKAQQKPDAVALAVPETEEEKILRVLRSSGGSAYQSAITEQLKFSKAKTSQLLTALEKRGCVARYKKGRDKIVNLVEEGKGDK